MRNALFYLTYNGLYNFTNGIGTQTQLLISGLEAMQDTLARRYGPIDLHVVCPLPDAHTWGFEHTSNLSKISGRSVRGRLSVRTSRRCCTRERRPMIGR
jgi:hypothetical protein